MFVPKAPDSDEELHARKFQQMEVGYRKLYAIKNTRKRDLSIWRCAGFEEVCYDKACSWAHSTRETRRGIDNLFSYQETQMSCQKYRTHDIKTGDETRISMLIWSDEIITDAVDNLKGIIERSQHANAILHENGSRGDFMAFSEQLTNARISVGKGGRVPQEVTDRFRAVVLLDASQLLTCVKDCFAREVERTTKTWAMNCHPENLDQKKIVLTAPAGRIPLPSATLETGIITCLSNVTNYQILFAPGCV